MAGQNNIRWRKSDDEKLRKAVKSYNAKLARLHKRDDIYHSLIPENVSYKEIKRQINNRSDFNKKLKELQIPSEDIIPARFGFTLTQRDKDTLKKEIRKFNAKIDRLAKKDPHMKSSLPERLKYSDYKRLIHTRDDLRSELKSIRGFLKDGAETLVKAPDNADDNIFITKWQRDDMLRRESIVNISRKARKERYEQLQAKDRGEELGYTVGDRQTQIGMGKAEEKMYNEITAFYPSQSKWDIRARQRTLRLESQSDYWTMRDFLLKENYIKSIERNFPEKYVKGIVNKLRSMDMDEFMRVYYEEGLDIDDQYKEDADEMMTQLSTIAAIWTPNK